VENLMTYPGAAPAVISTTPIRTDAPPAGLALNRLHRTYGDVRALDGLDLVIAPGEMVALLGPSGCGKTTALRIIAGFERPDSGSVLLAGRDITSVGPAKRDMGMVFQSYSLFPHLSAADNVAFGLRIRRVAAGVRRTKAVELLDLVGMAALADRYPHQLSGGQQQRVALARALAITPSVLLLDEPLSALDAKVRLQLREEIRRLQISLGITTVLVTHDQEEALSVADRVAVMRAGRLEQCAPPAELYARPATAFVAEFVGTMNRIKAVMGTDDLVTIGDQRLPVDGEHPSANTPVWVLTRPESVVVSATASDASPDTSSLVQVATFLGAITRLTLTRPDGTDVKADLPSHEASAFPIGSYATVRLAQRPVLVVPR
jgi:putative spermidine/putrescine transport system ATP-binding protein